MRTQIQKFTSLILALLLCLSLSAPAFAEQRAEDSWYYDAVQWSLEEGLIASSGEAEFDAGQAITGEELSEILTRLTGSGAGSGTSALTRIEALSMLSDALRPSLAYDGWHPFTDTADEASAVLSWAWQEGIINGTSAAAFSPDAVCTRAQALTMLYRWAQRHPTYALESVYTVETQGIGLTGIGNARELGGYVAEDGRTVKHGVLLRSAKPGDGTAEDLERLRETYHLTVLADFRGDSEVAQAPDPEIDGVTNLWLPIMDAELTAKRSAAMAENLAAKGTDYRSADSLTLLSAAADAGFINDRMYIEFLGGNEGKAGYRALFEELLSLPEGQSLLFHCTQGKDRTGVAAMLILSALGVDEDTILRDYLLTNEFNAQKIAAERKMLTEAGFSLEKIELYLCAMDQVNVAFMRNALDWMRENYGSPEGYLTAELNLNAEKLALLRDKFLEKPTEKPVIGLAWVSVEDSEFFTNVYQAVEAAGGIPVMLNQVVTPELSYSGGMLTDGVAETGALTETAGQRIRERSWAGSNAAEVMQGIDAVVFTGGEDISPSLYRKPEEWHGIEAERDYNAERDVSDYLLMEYCLDMDIPFMGFCRGMQMLGVVSGGEVIQDIPTYFEGLSKEYHYEHRNEKETPDAYRNYASHAIQVTTRDSVLYDIVGADALTGCPSWHHQALKSVQGTELAVTGVTPTSGIDMIEAIQRTDKAFAVGFQFHPEAVIARTLSSAGDVERFMDYETALAFYTVLIEKASSDAKSAGIAA